MKKIFSILYRLCWICLAWGVIAAIPHEPIQMFSMQEYEQIPWLKILLILLMVLFLMLINWLLLHSTPVRLKLLVRGAKVLLLIAMALCGELVYACFSPFATQLGWGLGGVMLILLVALVISLATILKEPQHNKTFVLWEMVFLVAATIGVSLWIPRMWGLPPLQVTHNYDLLSYHIGQLSLTFVTISVMSVLSDKSVIIYWENIAEAKLLRPVFISFASCTAYSITAAVGAGISVLLKNAPAFFVFFGCNVVALIILTLTMVDVYFNREQKKQRLEQQLQRASGEAFIEMLRDLEQNLYQSIERHDLQFVREVAQLYGAYAYRFESAEGQKIKKLLDSTELHIEDCMRTGIRKRLSQLRQTHEMQNVLANGKWNEDVALWKMLSENARKGGSLTGMLGKYSVTVERMDLLFADIFNNVLPLHNKNYISTYRITLMLKSSYGVSQRERRKIRQGFSLFMSQYVNDDGICFLTALLRMLLLSLPKNVAVGKITNHPLLIGLQPYISTLQLTAEEQQRLELLLEDN